MPLSWRDFVGIRGLNQENYFKKFSSYEQFVSSLNKGDVVPPPKSEVERFFVVEEPQVVEVVEAVEAVEAKPPPKKRAARKPAAKKASTTAHKTDISKRSSPTKKRRTTRKKTPAK